jgi:Glycosyl hydrolase family 26
MKSMGKWLTLAGVLALFACGPQGLEPDGQGGGAAPEQPPVTSPEPSPSAPDQPLSAGGALPVPPAGQLYHGVMPVTFEDAEPDTDISRTNLDAYERTVGRKVAWVYMDHNWFQQREFPVQTARWVRERGAVPFIRLMLRSFIGEKRPEEVYTLDRILAGDFDADLDAWGDAAREFGTPFIAEWGTEANGDWFHWSPMKNGGGLEEGAAKFRAAYRYIVQRVRARGASNVIWAFHVNAETFPNDPRNSMKALYPGADVVDWVGLSVYGSQSPLVPRCEGFAKLVDAALPELRAAAPGKPVFIFEFGITANHPNCDANAWTKEAVDGMLGGRWPELSGFSWWNERWKNDADPSHDTNMLVQEVPEIGDVFREAFSGPFQGALVDRPLWR